MKGESKENIFDFVSKKASQAKKIVRKKEEASRPSQPAPTPTPSPVVPSTPESPKKEYTYKPTDPSKVRLYDEKGKPLIHRYNLPSEPAPPPKAASKFRPYFKRKDYYDPETIKILEKINRMRRELENKLEKLYEKSGMSKEQFQAYLDNPQNAKSALWRRIHVQRGEIKERLHKMFGIEEKIKAEVEAKQEGVKGMKNRKSKTLGDRKKWIPIR